MSQSSKSSIGSLSVRTFLKSILGLAAVFVGTAARAQTPPREKLTLSQFIARVRADPALRARFAATPRLVLGEFGIDPAPYNLPERISDAQMNRLLEDLARQAGGAPSPPPRGPGPGPVAVYGPPSRPLPKP